MNSNSLHEIPPHWTRAKLGDISEVGQGGTPSTKKKEYWNGNIPWLRSGEINFNRIKSALTAITDLGLKNSPAKLLPRGTVILAMTGQGLTRGRASILEIDASANQSCAHIIPDLTIVTSEFLFYYFQKEYWNIRRIDKGSNQPGLNTTIIKQFEIPLPPVAEQRRIVAKIEEVFQELRTARQALQKTPDLIRRFRQAVLVDAFQGRLSGNGSSSAPKASAGLLRADAQKTSNDWQDKGTTERFGEKWRPSRDPMTDSSGKPRAIPAGWFWTRLGELLEVVQYGSSVKASASGSQGVPILRMGNIRDGKLDFSNLKYMDPRDDDISRYMLKPGDILINRTNSPELVGKSALFNGEGRFVFASYLIRLRVKASVANPSYTNYVINSFVGRRHIDAMKHQVAGQSNINTKDIESMPVPLPPLAEQGIIAERISEAFAHADQVDEAVETSLEQIKSLEDSTLAKAFRGGLVTQDPSDEPASATLERLRIRSHESVKSRKKMS